MQESINLTPQQTIFTRSYTDPKSPTFGNASKSGLEAGYSKSYSENITHLSPDWLSEFIGKTGVLDQAGENLTSWVNTNDEHLLPFKFKATELVLKMAETSTAKNEDHLEKLSRKQTLSFYERGKIRDIVLQHRIDVRLPVQSPTEEQKLEIQRIMGMFRNDPREDLFRVTREQAPNLSLEQKEDLIRIINGQEPIDRRTSEVRLADEELKRKGQQLYGQFFQK